MSTSSDSDASQDRTNGTPATSDTTPSGTERGLARLRNPRSLERLRDRVQEAADELERLREENAALRERIEALETRPPVDPDATMLTFDEDPEALRRKVESFIDAIDAYLADAAPDDG